MNLILFTGSKDPIPAKLKDRRFFIVKLYEQCQYFLSSHGTKENPKSEEDWCGCGARSEETCCKDDDCQHLTILQPKED